MTFLDMARRTLEKTNAPLTSDEIWDRGIEYGYAQEVKTTGKTPQRTIAAQLYVNIRDDQKSFFCVASRRPTRFALSVWNKKVLSTEPAETIHKPASIAYRERDLHQILACFAYNYLNVLTRTIDDKISKVGPKGKNEWLHPDMVGLDISSIEMIPDRLYLFECHLFVYRDGRYFRLPYDRFADGFILPWQEYSKHEMSHLELKLVTIASRPPGVEVKYRGGKPVKFRVQLAGRRKNERRSAV